MELEEKLFDLIEQEIGVSPIVTKTENLLDLIKIAEAYSNGYTLNTCKHYTPHVGHDGFSSVSLSLVEFFIKCEEVFKIEFIDTEIDNILTIAELLDAIKQKKNSPKS